MQRKFTIITSQALSLVNFRGPLILALTKLGLRVYALAPDFDDDTRRKVMALGAEPVDISLSRVGRNPLIDLLDLWKLTKQLRRLETDFVLAYFIKPVTYGLIAARFAGISDTFAIIEGLGSSFSHYPIKTSHPKRRLLRRIVIFLYSVALKKCSRVFFLNDDDASLFKACGIVIERQIVRIDGIGLDLDHYVPAPPVLTPITFIMVARMLREKGVLDYIEAIRAVRKRHPTARFILVGGVDLNPDSIPEDELRGWEAEGLVEWTGNVSDVRPWLAQASVFVLPSFYREGIPRSSQEAMAMARPVITTDWTGCRETVEHGVNGFLVPVNNPAALTAAMEKFLKCPALIETMGRAGRRIAETRFNVHHLNAKILDTFGLGAVARPITVKSAKATQKILFYVQEDWYFISHRLQLAVAARAQGYDVVVLTRVGEHSSRILSEGMRLVHFNSFRGNVNPFTQLICFFRLLTILRLERPNIVHIVSLSTVVLGGFAARLSGRPRIINAITGFGSLSVGQTFEYRCLRFFSYKILKWQGHWSTMLVQHQSDKMLLERIGVPQERIRLIPSSGVNLHEFNSQPELEGDPVIVMCSRLLMEKGIEEFVAASRHLARDGIRAKFVLAGKQDRVNVSCIKMAKIDEWVSHGDITFLGWIDNIPKLLAESHIFCFPSRYGEGIPKVLLEAGAAALAIVTTDIPGCRDVVSNGDNGLLVPPGDSEALAVALTRLIRDPALRHEMGLRGRHIVQQRFGLDAVIRKTLAVYAEEPV